MAADDDGNRATTGWKALVPWVLTAAVLLATAVELALFGGRDVTGALTYAGRVSGVVFLIAAVLETAAVGALFDLAKPRPAPYSGAAVIVALLVSLLANIILLVLLLDGDFTPYAAFLALIPCACWSLVRLYKAGVWGRVPHPRGIALGVVLTGALAVANFTHAQVYQPYAATATLTTTVEFGKATVNEKNGSVSVPVRLRTHNTGEVSLYLLGSLYQVSALRDSYVARARPDQRWLQDINSGQRDLARHTDVTPGAYDLLAQGAFAGRAGLVQVLEPGAEIVTQNLVEFPRVPKGKPFVSLAAAANVVYLRKDRARLVDDYARSGRSSWTQQYEYGSANKAPAWVTGGGRVNTFRYQSRIRHSTAVLEYTRAPHYVTLWWVLSELRKEGPFGPDLVAVVGPGDAVSRPPTPSERHRMRERYGLGYGPSGALHVSLDELLKDP
ncbi:hypothetical protein [Streptomyces sp. NPDC056144]|uniref:hypothetical protein n=1 Tax=unclassified Streptomyces TaxID=2593676 RepID=UPI0035DC2E0B